MCGRGQYGFLLGVLSVDLRSFHYLQTLDSMAVEREERPSARLSLVLYHPTHTYGSVQQATELFGFFLRCFFVKAFRCRQVEFFGGKTGYLPQVCCTGFFVQNVQAVKDLLLQLQQNASQHLFVNYGGVLHPVGHDVVDVLDEDNVGTAFVEILYQRPVSGRSENQFPFVVTQGCVVLVDSDGVGVMLLLREGYV